VPPPKVVAPPPGDAVLYFWSVFSGKSLQLLPPDVRFLGLNAPNSISAGAPPQTPLGKLIALDLRGLLLRGGRRGEGREREGRKCRVPSHTFE